MIKKISLYIIFLITISATAFANTCDIFEDALIGNESVSYDPFYNINKDEYEKLNLFGLILDEVNEGEDFLNINLINPLNPSINDKIKKSDKIYSINRKKIDQLNLVDAYLIQSESGYAVDAMYMNDLKYLLKSGLIDEFTDQNFILDIQETNNTLKTLKEHELSNINFEIELGIYRSDGEKNINSDIDFDKDLIYVKIKPELTPLTISYETYLDIYNISDIDGKNNFFESSYRFEVKRFDNNTVHNLLAEKFGKTSEESNSPWCLWNNKDDINEWGELEYIWSPSFDFINALEMSNNKIKKELYISYTFDTEKVKGFTTISHVNKGSAKFSTDFNYATFPFDEQNISIDIANHDGSGYGIGSIEDVNFELFLSSDIGNDESVFNNPRYRYSKQNTVSGWNIGEKSVYKEYFDLWINPTLKEANTITTIFGIQVKVDRNTKYFIFKIFSPILLILLVCWSVFWTPSKELESRLTVTITCFLALVAYTFVIDDDVPKLDYLTLMDRIILISYVFAAIPTLITIFSHKIYLTNESIAHSIDKYSKFLGPIFYVMIIYTLIYSMTLGNIEHSNDLIKAMIFYD